MSSATMSPDNSQADVDYLPGSRSDREVSVHEAKVARKSISSGRKSRTRAIHRSVFPDTMVVTLLDFVDNHLDAYSNYKDCCKDARHVLIESYQDEQIPTTTQIYNKLVGMFRIYGRKDDLEEGETVPHRIWTRGRAAFPKLPAQMRSKPESALSIDDAIQDHSARLVPPVTGYSDRLNPAITNPVQESRISVQLPHSSQLPRRASIRSNQKILAPKTMRSSRLKDGAKRPSGMRKPSEVIQLNDSGPRVHHASKSSRRISKAIDEFLEEDGNLEMIAPQTMADSMTGLYNTINHVVDNFLSASKRNPEKLPHLDPTVLTPDLHALAGLVFGFGDKRTLLDAIADAQKVSRLTMQVFLRAVIATAVVEWAFRAWSLPSFDKRCLQLDMLEDVIRKVSPEMLDIMTRNSKTAYIKRVMKNDLDIHACNLGSRLDGCLSELTAAPVDAASTEELHCDCDWPEVWRRGLTNIFKSALEIRLRLEQSPATYRFNLPRFQDPFDSSYMVTEEVFPSRQASTKVYVALSCAIYAFYPGGRLPETVLSKATVSLF